MRKRHLLLFAALWAFWLALSAEFDPEHLVTGAALALLLTWFWRDLATLLPSRPFARLWLAFFRYLAILAWEIILANVAVISNLFAPTNRMQPGFVYFRPDLRTGWGRILLATSITLTPGTVTIDVNPDDGSFMVHGLTSRMKEEVVSSRLIREIRRLEDSGGSKG